MKRVCDRLLHRRKKRRVLRADVHHRAEIRPQTFFIRLLRQVRFIEDRHGRPARALFRQRKIGGGERRGAVEHCKDQAGAFQVAVAAADAFRLHQIVGVPDTRRIRQKQTNPGQLDLLLHHVPCGTRHGRNDGTLKTGEQVQQRAFAHVWAADDGCVHTAAQHRARIIARNQLIQRCLRAPEGSFQRLHRKLRYIFLRIIRIGSDMSGERHKVFLHRFYLCVQRSFHGGSGGSGGLPGGSVDQIHYSFRLCERDTPGQKRAFCKFARPGRSCASRTAGAQQARAHGTAAVAGKLHHILARIAVRRAEAKRYHLVAQRPVLHKMAEQRCITRRGTQAFIRIFGPEYRFGHAVSPAAGNTHDGDAPHARRRSNGRDGPILLHQSPHAPFFSNSFNCSTNVNGSQDRTYLQAAQIF